MSQNKIISVPAGDALITVVGNPVPAGDTLITEPGTTVSPVDTLTTGPGTRVSGGDTLTTMPGTPAQAGDTLRQAVPKATDAVEDTTDKFQSKTSADTLKDTVKVRARPFEPKKNATVAMLLSAVLPSAGQFYNEDYWKIPIILGIGGYWVHEWSTLNKNYKFWRSEYSKILQSDADPKIINAYWGLREFYRDERDKFAWYIGALYFINILDAYVGAHLYDFDVGPDLTMRWGVQPGISASLKIYF